MDCDSSTHTRRTLALFVSVKLQKGLFISRLLARLCSSPCPCSSAKPTAAAPSAAQRVSQPATAAAAASEAACASWTWGPVAPSARRYPGVSTVCLSCRDSPYSSSSSSGSSDSGSDSISRSTLSVLGGVRGYRTRINWMRVRFRARVSLFVKQGLKPKNHSKVLTRFRLTRFGWQRLRRGRNGVKFNLVGDKNYPELPEATKGIHLLPRQRKSFFLIGEHHVFNRDY
ncbi:hypothetical protein Esti_005786 [Eimeria stiedai]